jgi:hypothetical protein
MKCHDMLKQIKRK